MTLNTYKEIEHLKKLGASTELAEAIVELHTKSDEHLVTKGDLNRDIGDLKSELKSQIYESKNDLKLELAKIEGEIKAINRDKILDRSLLIGIFLMMIGYLIKTLVH